MVSDFNTARKALRNYGISTVNNKKGGFNVAIASNHAKLAELLKDTPWHSSYNHVISRIENAEKKTAVFADGMRAQAVVFPASELFSEDEDILDGVVEGF